MKIKKFQGNTETEAMLKVKEELGKEALILNIKTIKPKGFYRFFKKPSIEITAATDEKSKQVPEKKVLQQMPVDTQVETQPMIKPIDGLSSSLDVTTLEKKINDLQELLERQVIKTTPTEQESVNEQLSVLQLIYNQLINNEVHETVANELVKDLENADLDQGLAKIYKRIVDWLGRPKTILLDEEQKQPKVVFFVGPTGVGKTTTIAKIASHFSLKENKKVGLITADTYRVAAVEQLKTYANILCVPLKVIYSQDEVNEAIEAYSDRDLIFVDTAGRSHKNDAQYEEIRSLIQATDNKDIFLVLSATTKYKDLLKITEKYAVVSDYNIIFTKLDETSCYGNILNIKMRTGANLSYATFGQNVPDDIGEINPQEVAKHLLGGTE